MNLFRKFFKLTFITIACVVLAGCVTAQYAVGTIDSVTQGRSRQFAVLEFDLVIDSVKYVVRAPAECRSLVNPFSRIRTTENSGRAFEFKLKNGQSAILSTNYSCSEEDATIVLAYSQLMSVYRVDQQHKAAITQDWVVPVENPEAATAKVVLTRMGIDHIRADSNTTVISDMSNALKRLAGIPDNRALAALFSPRMALGSTIVGFENLKMLQNFSEAQPLPGGMPKGIVDRLNAAGYSGLKASSKELATKITEVPFEYSELQNTFHPNVSSLGRRLFYAIPITVCGRPANCIYGHTSVQIDNLKVPTSEYRFTFSPTSKLVYMRQNDEF